MMTCLAYGAGIGSKAELTPALRGFDSPPLHQVRHKKDL